MKRRQGLRPVSRRIGYDDHTGAPEDLPRDFMRVAIDFPERIYGTWWYINDDGTRGDTEGWYIWLNSVMLLGVSRGEHIAWRSVDDFEIALTYVASRMKP